MLKSFRGAVVLICFVLSPLAFSGGFEKPTWAGAQNAGMGGTGIAFTRGMAATYYNPANFAFFVETFAIGYDSLPTFTSVEADLSDLRDPANNTQAVTINGASKSIAGSKNEQSELVMVPIINIGGVFRFADWLLFGLGLYSPAGLSTRFENVGEARVLLDVDFKVLELAPFVIFEIFPETFAVAVQYRILWGHFDQRYAAELASPDIIFLQYQDIDGFEFHGGRVGALLNTGKLRIGLVVRNEIDVDGFDGDAVVRVPDGGGGALTFKREVEINDARLPWEIAGGLAFVAPNSIFVVAADAGYRFYESSNVIDFDIKNFPPAAPNLNEPTFDLVLDWHNSVFVRFGGEVKIHDHYFVRMGWGVITHVTNKKLDSPLLTVPEHGLSFGFGFGFRGENFIADFSFDCNFANGKGQFGPPFVAAGAAVDAEGRSLAATPLYRTHKGFAYSMGFSLTYYGGGAPG